MNQTEIEKISADLDLAFSILTELANGMIDYDKKIRELAYRTDYADFLILLNDESFVLIPSELIRSFSRYRTIPIKRDIEDLLLGAERLEKKDNKGPVVKPKDEPKS